MDQWGSFNWQDIGKRALKTFVQAFLSLMTVGMFTGMFDGTATVDGLKTVVVSALAAAYSVLWNAGMEWANGRSQ